MHNLIPPGGADIPVPILKLRPGVSLEQVPDTDIALHRERTAPMHQEAAE